MVCVLYFVTLVISWVRALRCVGTGSNKGVVFVSRQFVLFGKFGVPNQRSYCHNQWDKTQENRMVCAGFAVLLCGYPICEKR